MLVLFLWELGIFLTPITTHEMSVDLLGGELLPIHFNITFPAMPCSLIGVDALDMSGKLAGLSLSQVFFFLLSLF